MYSAVFNAIFFELLLLLLKKFNFYLNGCHIVFVWYISVEYAEMELKINYKILGSTQIGT